MEYSKQFQAGFAVITRTFITIAVIPVTGCKIGIDPEQFACECGKFCMIFFQQNGCYEYIIGTPRCPVDRVRGIIPAVCFAGFRIIKCIVDYTLQSHFADLFRKIFNFLIQFFAENMMKNRHNSSGFRREQIDRFPIHQGIFYPMGMCRDAPGEFFGDRKNMIQQPGHIFFFVTGQTECQRKISHIRTAFVIRILITDTVTIDCKPAEF